MRITLIDEINCVIEGLSKFDLRHLQRQTRVMEKGAYMTAAFKLGEWDGYQHFIDEEGFTFIYLLDTILDCLLDELDYDPDAIEFVDERKESPLPPDFPLIDERYLIDETGILLREHQVSAINVALETKKGILHLATNAGKTLTALGISKAIDPYLKTITTAPSEQLCEQTLRDFKNSYLSCGYLSKKIPTKKREQFIEETRHIIVTPQLLFNCIDFFTDGEWGIMVDECHRFGDKFSDTLRFDLPEAPLRIGFTGTVPSNNKLKYTKLKCMLGNRVIKTVTNHEMIEKGYSSKVSIEMVRTEDTILQEIQEEMKDWSVEQSYMYKNKQRGKAIREYIESLPVKNTLVLCDAEMSDVLIPEGEFFIDKDVKTEDRKDAFACFRDNDNVIQYASFGTASTGISENRIFRLVIIDAGKDIIKVIQSIGRGIRIDGKFNELEVVDISSNGYYGERHYKERKKAYKKEKYPFFEIKQTIKIEDFE